MSGLFKLLMFAAYIAVGITDLLILFIVVHLLLCLFPTSKGLLFLDQIGTPAVHAVVGATARRLKRHWDPPLSHCQEEVVALGILLASRWILTFFIA
jgi:hypothetical protein